VWEISFFCPFFEKTKKTKKISLTKKEEARRNPLLPVLHIHIHEQIKTERKKEHLAGESRGESFMNDDESCCSFFFNSCVSRAPRVFDFPSLQAYNPKNTNAFFTHLNASLERLGTSNLPSLCLNAVISRCGVEELSILLRRYWVAFWMS